MPSTPSPPIAAVDLFAGPGGWDLALARLTDRPAVGLEWDRHACLTATAAGLHRIRADVAHYPPERFAGIPGLIGSPPCPSFSQSGNRGGRHILALLDAGLADVLAGRDVRADVLTASIPLIRAALAAENTRRKPAKRRTDEQLDTEARRQAAMSTLILEPARWTHATRPRWIACEQVPAALPLWQTLARLLAALGYSTWAGILNSADYGVPQTRQRAFLLASLDRAVHPPTPTHAKHPAADLFGNEPAPWVSMAAALGWGLTDRPAHTLPATSSHGGGPRPLDGGSHARSRYADARRNGRWVNAVLETGQLPNGPDRSYQHRPASEPAPTVAGSSQRCVVHTKQTNGSGDDHERPVDQPAPTVQTNANRWTIRTAAKTRPQDGTLPRPIDEPAPTLTFGHAAASWVFERPATTVAGDPRIQPPGHKMNAADPEDRYATRAGVDAIRVEPWQAAILQDFPADYPWHGNLTQTFQQIGNAVPPGLAAAVLAAVLPESDIE